VPVAGFVVESVDPRRKLDGTLKLVDLAGCEILRQQQVGSARAAWARWQESRQLAVSAGPASVLFIEGQPDRLPRPGETLDQWLTGRTGSFRGFQVVWDLVPTHPPSITAFVDPLASRPIFLLETPGRILLADKLATLVVNSPHSECSWGGLLECGAVGSMYSPGTSIRDASMLRPGEIVEIAGATLVRSRCNRYPLDSAARPDPAASERLETALRTAIRETWTCPDTYLLLSGGLDSRMLLGLAGEARRAMSFDFYEDEFGITQAVAEACKASLTLLPFSPSHYIGLNENGYLITGGMHQSRFVNHLGAASAWRRCGVAGVTHGYFHNTIFRGWAAEYRQRYPERLSVLWRYMGRKAHYFDRFGCHSAAVASRFIDLLTGDARQLLASQLGSLAESIPEVVVDDYDLTFERLLLSEPGRQIYYGIVWGWIEEIDLQSPVFHAAVWDWYAATHPADRHLDRVVKSLYLASLPYLAEIPDSNSGVRVQPVAESRPAAWKNQFWFPAARAALNVVRRLGHRQRRAGGLDFAAIYRQPEIRIALAGGLEAAAPTGVFDRRALEAAHTAYLRGDERYRDCLWLAASIGQWARFAATGGAGHWPVREVNRAEGAAGGR
jgi:hypothetical protein